jgi:hypothetical protein
MSALHAIQEPVLRSTATVQTNTITTPGNQAMSGQFLRDPFPLEWRTGCSTLGNTSTLADDQKV